ncbi:glycosyl hydrolase 115 family protein [Thermoclostridium stercorarium]|uniref:glycosyl hydrolase 115 family protein n=1 Tax=Thermoclostridium stercorarium TaxID=1510 RepID=UPI00224953F0|nr:glycosyl hydrolase 115 family protein [Thermoclostridium stercorarium]UZQ86512.1 glycosyl hydrolase 115 family protein [Thermoclostridium stercorarium]
MNCFVLDVNTSFCLPKPMTKPVEHAAEILFRDFRKVFGKSPETTDSDGNASVVVRYAGQGDEIAGRPECFRISVFKNEKDDSCRMDITGSDDLGIIYALLYVSEKYLGVDRFWFWTEKEPEKRERIEIPPGVYISPSPKVRYRGWFVNDEVCLIGWTDVYPPPKEVWMPVFETLLRCGGNMVIPGTDLPRTGVHWDLALEMGLYITHHHAEPLGAEMFLRAYPDKSPSYDESKDLYEALWEDAIKKRKDEKVIWVLGFRGQGDCPFWENSPEYDTPEKRGELISRVIHRQYEILCKYVNNPPCAVYLYGEITELYRQGLINFPDGVIKIWSDNGYGEMVSRKQGNHNPRVPSLPTNKDVGPHGLYYHITFHDLQASNHLVMMPSQPEFIKNELVKAFNAGADYYLLLNCGNIRMHVYFLDLVSKIWSDGNIDTGVHMENFCKKYFSAAWEKALSCYRDYFRYAIRYGENPSDAAGDEYYHHPARMIIGHWVRGETKETAKDLLWATGELDFPEQVRFFYEKMINAVENFEKLKEKCVDTCNSLRREEAVFFKDNILFQVRFLLSGCKGFISLCKSFFEFEKGNYPLAFVYASQSMWEYGESLNVMAESEHGKWKNFYRADWLTNVKSTLYSLDTLRKYLRMHGDSPDFFIWYREYIMTEKVFLENTHRKPLSDDELAVKLKEKLLG